MVKHESMFVTEFSEIGKMKLDLQLQDKRKPTQEDGLKNMRFKWVKEKLSWCVDN